MGHGDGGHQIRPGVRKRLHLKAVARKAFVGRQRAVDRIAIAGRPDHPVQQDRHRVGFLRGAQLLREGHGLKIDLPNPCRIKAHHRAPGLPRPPGRGVQHKAGPGGPRKACVLQKIAGQGGAARVGFKQGEGREIRQVQPFVKDHDGFQAAVGQPGQGR